ncbi:M48 family metallopeptidase [Ideonella sp. BN130291]|uniref:M48 family metallopeptidase n=1 Tax=Ideonella sp. BN130291 TaxID=3112940 RepID=UPI002E274A8E|nr:M48 family metalloprotease [Ideonella sp. BN130291]
MEQADFIHLVRLSEQACESDAKSYRRSVWLFAVLGYAFIVGLAAVAAALLGFVWSTYHQHGFRAGLAWMAFAAAALLWVCVRALVTRFDEPEGFRLDRNDAPELFKAISRIRRAVKGPKIDVVLIDDRFNASIMQRPRFGLFGHTSYLTIGWPMLCALEPRRLLAVIAHEYGHLRGDHGKFSAWVYRTRMAWWRVYTAYHGDQSPVSWLLRRFFDWYIPRFNARTFALAREDEYEADRIAAKLCSPEIVGQAWNEIEVKTRWHDEEYWKDVWRRAFKQEKPEPMPHADMRRKLKRQPDEAFAQEAMRLALQRLPSYDDTHPVARDRLAALGVKPGIPQWSTRSSVQLLGDTAKRVAAHFDGLWWERVRRDWGRHREHLQRCMERIQALKARSSQLSADEWVDWADCFEALSSDDSTLLYEHALNVDPNHALALRRLGEARARSLHPQALDTLDRLQAHHPQHGYAACSIALELLDRLQHAGQDITTPVRRHWRERREHFDKLEQQAWQAFLQEDPCEHTTAPQWSDAERRRIVDELIRTPEVKAAWISGKNLSAMPHRPYLVLFVELAKRDESLAREVSERLMQRLSSFNGRLLVTVAGVFVKERDLDATGAQSIYRRQGK